MIKVIKPGNKIVKALNRIMKPCYPKVSMPIVSHEMEALRLLYGYGIVPEVYSYGVDYLEMSGVGEAVTKTSKFIDLEARCVYILDSLKKAGVQHNDIWYKGPRNCTVADGVLHLVDFQLASFGAHDFLDEVNAALKRYVGCSDAEGLERLKRWGC